MTEPYVGEIQLYGFPFTPKNWAVCTGATMAIRQNTTLFALIGVQYGGDGVMTFQLPNFVNCAPCSQGMGPGLTNRRMGERFGANGVSLTNDTMPAHIHQLEVYGTRASTDKVSSPVAGAAITPPGKCMAYVPGGVPDTTLAPSALATAGGNVSHENRQPFLALNYCIALQGVFPTFD
ncbi:MAG: phage tail protein [Brevundimonas sp.]